MDWEYIDCEAGDLASGPGDQVSGPSSVGYNGNMNFVTSHFQIWFPQLDNELVGYPVQVEHSW